MSTNPHIGYKDPAAPDRAYQNAVAMLVVLAFLFLVLFFAWPWIGEAIK